MARSRGARLCAYCKQPLPDLRLGISLTPLKARIFDIIQRGGADGVDRRDVFDIVFGQTNNDYKTLKAHINQINEKIASTGYRIQGYTMVRLVKSP